MADKPYVSPNRLKRFLTGLLGEKLNTKEEIIANTDVKKFAGAMAVQEIYEEINQSLANGQITFSVVNGEPYVKVGADTPRPFKSGDIITGSHTATEIYINSSKTVVLGNIGSNLNNVTVAITKITFRNEGSSDYGNYNLDNIYYDATSGNIYAVFSTTSSVGRYMSCDWVAFY